jgi:hypothetical protein
MVLSFDALKTMATAATKIIFPFEISSLIKQGAKYLGATESMDDTQTYEISLDESILGDIPTAERIKEVVQSIEDETRAIMNEQMQEDGNDISDLDEKKLMP